MIKKNQQVFSLCSNFEVEITGVSNFFPEVVVIFSQNNDKIQKPV